MKRVITPRYGRKLDDFEPGAVYAHPWEVTVDEGMMALFSASFLDATPVYASRPFARALGLRDRPVHPLLVLNLALSFSVHDVSEQAIAHLAYLDVRFPEPCYPGDTVRARSRVLGVKRTSGGDRGVVHVRTVLVNQVGIAVCAFERKALVPAGRTDGSVEHRAAPPTVVDTMAVRKVPPSLRSDVVLEHPDGFTTTFEDFEVGDVWVHAVGKTIGESEHMQLTALARNSHPLHFDEVYCLGASFARTRVVYGGLVLAWTLALASRDTAGNAIWEMGLDEGAHPSGVVAGDTIYAASCVIAKEAVTAAAGVVTFRVIGVKNARPGDLLARHTDPFAPELGKKDGKIPEKVVEITRSVLVRRRP
jgi:2-methylfumaryl-CoA hydratase